MNVGRSRINAVLWYGLTLLLCSGTVFMSFCPYPNIAYLLCRMCATLGVVIIGLCFCISILLKRDFLLPVHAVLKSFFFVGVLEMVYALLQIIGFLPTINPYYHFTGSFDNPAIFAMFISFCLPIGIYFTAKSIGFYRLVWVFFTFCLGAFLILSASRTGMLTGMCSVFIMMRHRFQGIKKYLPDRNRSAILLVIGILLLGGLYYWKQDSADGRLLAWQISVEMIADRPVFGWGSDGFDTFYMPYQADYFSRHPNSPFLLLADNLSHPFNEFLWFSVQYGIAGLIFLLFILGWG